MIKAVPGSERKLYNSLKDIGDCRVFHIFGEYDFFVMLEADDLFRIKKIVADISDMEYVAMVRPILVSNMIQQDDSRRIDKGPQKKLNSFMRVAC